MIRPLIAVVFYAILLIAGALTAWAILTRIGRLASRLAAIIASVAWLLAAAPPALGLVVDSLRAPVQCGVGEECYDYILWWLATPAGWLLAAALLLTAIAWRRSHPPRSASATHLEPPMREI